MLEIYVRPCASSTAVPPGCCVSGRVGVLPHGVAKALHPGVEPSQPHERLGPRPESDRTRCVAGEHAVELRDRSDEVSGTEKGDPEALAGIEIARLVGESLAERP